MEGNFWVWIPQIVGPIVFFAFLATCVIISAWKRKKIETARHETARLLIEKNPAAIDSAALAQLFNQQAFSIKSGAAYRTMKVFGTIVIAVGLGLWAMCLWFTFVSLEEKALGLGGPATLIIVIGAGVLFAARFMPRPPANDTETGASHVSPIGKPEP
jgi:hypothetical protein